MAINGGGYIKLSRSLRSHELWSVKPFSKGQAWVDLLLRAKWKDDPDPIKGSDITLKRGQIITSHLKLASEWGWDRRTIKAYLECITKAQMIVQQITQHYTIITICNFDTYQNGAMDNVQPLVQSHVQSFVQPDVQPIVHSKEYKEGINKKDTVGARTEPDQLSKNEKTKVFAWCIKQDTIYFTQERTVLSMPSKSAMLDDILNKSIPSSWDSETAKFMARREPIKANSSYYNLALQPYGIAKYLYDQIVTEYPPERFKLVRDAKINKQINDARLMIQEDKRPVELIKEVIDWMYHGEIRRFWYQNARSTEGLRRHFDSILNAMKHQNEQKPEHEQHTLSFSLNGRESTQEEIEEQEFTDTVTDE